MASEVEIANAALQKLGQSPITALDEGSRNSDACDLCYARLRRSEIRKHVWNFARTRTQLAASATAPLFGYANAFPLPSDFIRLLPPDPHLNHNAWDHQIETHVGAKAILTNDAAPLDIIYLADVVDPNLMDELFREALASRMAFEMCEALTQSNQKKADARTDYTAALREAKRINAFENISAEAPEDIWITARR